MRVQRTVNGSLSDSSGSSSDSSGSSSGRRRTRRVAGLVAGFAAATIALAMLAPVATAATRTGPPPDAAKPAPSPTWTPTSSGTGTAPSSTSAKRRSRRATTTPGSVRPANGELGRRAIVSPSAVKAQSAAPKAGTGTGSAGALSPASAASGTPGFTPLAPYRVLDTRNGTGVPPGAVGTRKYVDVTVLGVGGVPATGVDAVVLNVTVTAPSAGSWVAVYPAGATVPLASNLNFSRGLTVANLVVAKVGTGGAVRLYNNYGSVHLIADLAGYMATGSAFTGQAPVRILDTRSGVGAPRAKVGANASIDLQVTGMGGVPAAGVSAVAMNVTTTGATAGSYVTVYPTGTLPPTTSNLNMVAGQTVPVLVMATLGTAGKVSLYNHYGSTDLIADVAGWYATGGEYHPLPPARIFDSRQGFGALPPGGGVDLGLSGWKDVPVVGAASVVLSVTAVAPTAGGYLTVFPYSPGGLPPTASNLNFNRNATVPNLVVAKLGAGGWTSIYNRFGDTHVVVDVMGWFSTTQVQGLGVHASEAVTRTMTGATGFANSVNGVSTDGRYTLFTTTDSRMTPYQTSSHDAVFVRDSVLGITTSVMASDAGPVTGLGLSYDGRYALWMSALPFVGGDTNGAEDAYVTDLFTGWSYLVSFNTKTHLGGNGATTEASMSPSGQYISFVSAATNLTASDTDGVSDVFVTDLWAKDSVFTLIAPAATGALSTQAVADNGSVAYTAGSPHTAYVWDSSTASATALTSAASGWSDAASLSGNGQYVTFLTTVALKPADTNGLSDVYLRDLSTGTDTLVSAGTGGSGANSLADPPMISADGSVVAFASHATNLVAGTPAASHEVYLYSRTATTLILASSTSKGIPSGGDSQDVRISATGRYVAYRTNATNLVSGGSGTIGVITRLA